ncbi:RNA methyltransferase [Myxococcota bacterium]|nr:RNA methyltransferase [Myxococcota bacterium]
MTPPFSWPTSQTPDLPKFLAALQRTESSKGRRTTQTFSIEGTRLLERALDEQQPLLGVLVAEEMAQSPTPRETALLERLTRLAIPLHIAPTERLHALVQGRTFGLCLGLVRLPPSDDLNDMISFMAQARPLKILVLVDVMDPGNLGAMMRTGAASGIDALLVWGGTDPFHPKAARTSMGAIFVNRIYTPHRFVDLLDTLHAHHIETIGAVVEGGLFPDGTVLSTRHALLMGSEAHGLPTDLQSRLLRRWSIPMHQGVDSFSVNAAAAILLYESLRKPPITNNPLHDSPSE